MHRTLLSALAPVLLWLSGCQSASSLLDAGNDCYLRGDYEASIHHYRAARRKDPTLMEIDEKIHRAEVSLFLQRGDRAMERRQWESAERAFNEVRRLDPGSIEVTERLRRLALARAAEHFQRGQELALAGNPFEAITQFEQALVFQPDHRRAAEALERMRAQGEDQKRRAEAAFREGERAQAAERFEEAVQHFTRALDLNPYHAGARREIGEAKRRIAESLARRGDALARERSWSQASGFYRRAQEHYPELPGLAERLHRAEKEDRAQTALEEGNRAFDRGDWRTAFERFEEACKLTEDRQRFRVRHETARDQLATALDAEARAEERRGRLEEALALYRRIVVFHPRYRDVEARCERLRVSLEFTHGAYEAGCQAQARRDLTGARKFFLSCQEKQPGYRDLESRLREVEAGLEKSNDLHRLAVEAEQRCELEKARSLYEQSLGICASSGRTEERLSHVVASLNALEEARKLERERRLSVALERYEEVLKRHQGLTRARERAEEIRRTCGALEVRYRSLLDAQRQQSFHDALSQAREIQKECLGFRDVDQRLSGLELEVDYADAGALEAKEEYDEAIRCLERCAKRTPGFRDVAERLRRCREKRGHHHRGAQDQRPEQGR